MRKSKIIYRSGRKALKKLIKGDLKYRNKNPAQLIALTTKQIIQNGPKQTLVKIKKELLSIDRHIGNNLAFPNGIVTGVDPNAVKHWYAHSARKVTIVIPSYNDFEVLRPCVESLKRTTDPEKVAIIIVDDYCKPSSKKQLKLLEDDQVKIIYRTKNGGFAKAVNAGLRAADKKNDVILVNSDILAHDGWLESLTYGAYEFGVDTGIVGPKLLYPDGRIQSAGTHRNTESPKWFDHYYRFQDSNYGPANIPQYCLAVTGACMYIKREYMDYVGLLDEKYEFAFEDVDYCLRGWEAGYRTLYFPLSTLTHIESATRAKNKAITTKEKQSIDYFWQKWGDWFDKRNVRDSDGRIKLIFILQSMGMSGGIKAVFEQANMLSDRGFNIEIWGLDSHNRPWDISDKIKIKTFKNYERLIVALSNEEAIKIATWWETSFPVWLSSIRKGIAVYLIQEFETWFYPDDVLAQATVVSCYRKEFINLTESTYNQQELANIGLSSTYIPHGFDDTYYKPLNLKRETNTVLGVGRTFFQKNFKFTFDAWKFLGDNRPNMWLFGAEPEMAEMDKKIKYFTKPSNEEVNKLYNKAAVFIQTSKHEGFCLPILEAMATGCPIICTDAHGNRDFCHDGVNCLMVNHDDIEGLSKAIEKVLKDKKLREKLSQGALKTAQNYKWKGIIEKVDQFYKEVAK